MGPYAAVFAAALLICVIVTEGRSTGNTQIPHLTDTRIVGGVVTDITAHPHQVSLRYKDILTPQNAYTHRCGGSIYTEDLIITAAHCIIAKVPSQFQVVAGTNNRRGSDGIIVPVKEIIMHENYNPNTYDNDIAILKLGASLPLDNFTMQAIELASVHPRDSDWSVITGWGTTTQGGTASDLLQEVHVPIVSNDKCEEDYGPGVIKESMLCAGLRGEGGKDACQGDSGGPLLVKNKLAGVVSWGYGCAQAKYPGVYANAFTLGSWVLEKAQKFQ